MPTVPAAGIILTNNYEAIRAIFKKGKAASLSDAIGRDKSIYYFSNTSDSNLISFRGTWSSTGAKSMGFTIGLIDPTKDFEEKFVKLNIPSQVVNSLESFDGLGFKDESFTPNESNRVNEIIKILRTRKSSTDTELLARNSDRLALLQDEGGLFGVNSFFQNPDTGKITFNEFSGHVAFSDSLKAFELAAKRDKEFKVKILEKNESFIGTGKEKLITDATNKLIKKAIPSNQFYIAFGLGEDTSTWGGPFSVVLNGAEMSVSDDKVRIITLKFAYCNGLFNTDLDKSPLNLDMMGYGIIAQGRSDLIVLNPEGKKSLGRPNTKPRDVLKNLNLHQIVNQCLRRYLVSCTNSNNIIVLLPNINESNHFQMAELYSSIVGRSFNTPLSENDKEFDVTRFSASIETYIKVVLSKFGIRIEKERSDLATISPIHLKNIESQSQVVTPFRAVITSDYRDYSDRFWSDKDEEFKNLQLPSFQDPINRVIEQITFGKNELDLQSQWWEGNTDIVEVWHKYFPNAVPDKDKPVLLLGSRDIIKNVMYGSFEQGVNHIMHPDDEKLFNNVNMHVDIRKAVTGPTKELLRTPLGEFFSLPGSDSTDELAFDKKLQDNLEVCSTPIFRVNTERPNVLDMNITYDTTYFGFLQAGFEAAYQNYPMLSEKSFKELEGKYSKHHDWFRIIEQMRVQEIPKAEASKFLSKALEVDPVNNQELTELVAFIYGLNVLDPKRPKIPIYNESGASPISVQAQILQNVIAKSLNISITTLPLFTVSNNYFLTHRCRLEGQQPQIIGSSLGGKYVDSFYSGYYKMMAWEHIISSDRVESSFSLLPDLNTLKNEDLNVEDERVGEWIDVEDPIILRR